MPDKYANGAANIAAPLEMHRHRARGRSGGRHGGGRLPGVALEDQAWLRPRISIAELPELSDAALNQLVAVWTPAHCRGKGGKHRRLRVADVSAYQGRRDAQRGIGAGC